jgi:hypothetical protein
MHPLKVTQSASYVLSYVQSLGGVLALNGEILVQCLRIGPINPATGMHTLKHAKHADGSPVGNFIPLNQLCAFISVIPQLGDVVDARIKKA